MKYNVNGKETSDPKKAAQWFIKKHDSGWFAKLERLHDGAWQPLAIANQKQPNQERD
jgi:hypothetical protein